MSVTFDNYHDDTFAYFKPLAPTIGRALVAFAYRRNLGKAVTIDGKRYTLRHLSIGKNAMFRSRGYSVYFERGRSVVRVSDHWSASRHSPRSGKLNCGFLRSCSWKILDRKGDRFEASGLECGKYAYTLLAGMCSLKSFTVNQAAVEARARRIAEMNAMHGAGTAAL